MRQKTERPRDGGGELTRRDFLKSAGITISGGAVAGSAAFASQSANLSTHAVGEKSQRGHAFDVIVVGATSAGVGAAIAAGRQGMKVALIEETPTLGGMLANGLSNTDLRSPGGSTGIFEEFRLRSKRYYTERFPDDPVMKSVYFAREGFRYEPHVADGIFKRMISEIPSIQVFYKRVPTAVLRDRNRVRGVTTHDVEGGNAAEFLASITIDATHEGDLLPLAGAKFRVGREPRTQEEPHAGKTYMTSTGETFGSGAGDALIQAYAMLLTIKDYGPGADKTIARPPGYNPRNYAPLPRDETFWYRGGILPNGKFEVNENLDGTDAVGLNAGYLDGDRSVRRRVWEKYRDYALGYLYFRQTVMGEKNYGLAEDEYPDHHNLPYILYVREGRRLEGLHMFNERDAIRVPGFLRPPLQRDSVAIGDWPIDSHAVSRSDEGYVFLSGGADKYHIMAPHQAPYQIMVPSEIDGLLVPMAVSATHVGFQVLRLEPIRIALGQAAGNAAALCVRNHLQPRQVPVPQLQELLLGQGCSLFYYKDLAPTHPHYKPIQRLSISGVVEGYDDFTFQPDKHATKADVAKIVFRAFGLDVKMDFSQMWALEAWRRGSDHQIFWPSHWATYYLLTLHNMGAFEEAPDKVNPDAPATRREVGKWSATAAGVNATEHTRLLPNGAGDDGPITRGEVCSMVEALREQLRNNTSS
jgi:FAD dependent oxidoreductase/S-layer homology domain